MRIRYRIHRSNLVRICLGYCDTDQHVVRDDDGNIFIESCGQYLDLDVKSTRQIRNLAAQLLWLADHCDHEYRAFEPAPEDRADAERRRRFELEWPADEPLPEGALDK